MLKALALLVIRSYQRFSKNRKYSVCKFDPSCSEYAKVCFQRFSFITACKLTKNRLERCDSNYPKEVDNPPKINFNNDNL